MPEKQPQTLQEYLLREALRWEQEAEAWESVLWTDETGVELMHLMNKCRKNAFRLRTDAEAVADRVVVKPEVVSAAPKKAYSAGIEMAWGSWQATPEAALEALRRILREENCEWPQGGGHK